MGCETKFFVSLNFGLFLWNSICDRIYIFIMNSKPTPQSLLQQAAQIPQLERGKLSIIREGPDGPYYNHQCREDGKNVSRYVPREQVSAVQEAIEGYGKFTGLIKQYVDQLVEETRKQIAADSKKKPKSRPSSSSPKTPKSSR